MSAPNNKAAFRTEVEGRGKQFGSIYLGGCGSAELERIPRHYIAPAAKALTTSGKKLTMSGKKLTMSGKNGVFLR
jgi:hypothetical protein